MEGVFSMAILHGWIQRLGVQFCGSVMGTQKQNLSNDVDLLIILSFNKKKLLMNTIIKFLIKLRQSLKFSV